MNEQTEIDTPFKIGQTYPLRDGRRGRILGFVPEIDQPMVVYVHGAHSIASYFLNGLWSTEETPHDLIPPKTLPSLPPGREWIHPEEITQPMIDAGFRPILKGEILPDDAQLKIRGSGAWLSSECRGEIDSQDADFIYRTKRPLPPEKKRVPLGPEDVPPGSAVKHEALGVNWAMVIGLNSSGAVWQRTVDSTCYKKWNELMIEKFLILRPGGEWKPMWKEVEA